MIVSGSSWRSLQVSITCMKYILLRRANWSAPSCLGYIFLKLSGCGIFSKPAGIRSKRPAECGMNMLKVGGLAVATQECAMKRVLLGLTVGILFAYHVGGGPRPRWSLCRLSAA